MGICNVCGILLILTRTFSMVKICEVKLTINMRDVPYVICMWFDPDPVSSMISWYVVSVLCIAMHCVWQSSWICCPDLFEALQVIFFGFSDIYKMRILLETTKPKLIVTSWKLSLRDTSWALGKEFAMRHGAKQCVADPDPRTRCSTPSSVQLTLPLGERCWK
jgi:hypothetical protein